MKSDCTLCATCTNDINGSCQVIAAGEMRDDIPTIDACPEYQEAQHQPEQAPIDGESRPSAVAAMESEEYQDNSTQNNPEDPWLGYVPAIGSFVHPVARPGHIAFTLLVIDPAEVGQTPIIGSSIVKVAFPDLNLPENFNFMTLAEQEAVWQRLTALLPVRNESIVPIEAKGLCFVSEEFLYEHFPDVWKAQYGYENEPESPSNVAQKSFVGTIAP